MTLAVRWVHVLSAIVWVGGMLFIALALVPVLRRLDDAALRRRLVHAVGIRFRTVGWIALGALVLTGLGSLWLRPYLLGTGRLHLKLGLVLVALALGAVHDFVLGPRAGAPGADPGLRARASWVARVNVVVVALVVLLGLALRG
jgi:uncharacterized membrane protein